DEEKYKQDDGIKYIMAPPLRKSEDREALWQGIKDGDVDVIATDHCPFNYKKDKLPHKDNFLNCPGGAPGVEERLELVISEALKRHISLDHIVNLLATNPSNMVGLYPKKGTKKVGSDADIVILKEEAYI